MFTTKPLHLSHLANAVSINCHHLWWGLTTPARLPMNTHQTFAPRDAPTEPARGPRGLLPFHLRATQLAVANGALTAARVLVYEGQGLRFATDPEGARWFPLIDIGRAVGDIGMGGMRKRAHRKGDMKDVRVWVPNTVYPKDSGWRMLQAVREGGIQTMMAPNRNPLAVALALWFESIGADRAEEHPCVHGRGG